MYNELNSERYKMTKDEEIKKLKEALKIAAAALEIASDWNVNAVQVNPPKEWELDDGGEDESQGWCSTSHLARKLKSLAQ
jgi:hypothetical protein